MAVQTNDVVPLPITFVTGKFCEKFTYEENFNNTFFVKVLLCHRCGAELMQI